MTHQDTLAPHFAAIASARDDGSNDDELRAYQDALEAACALLGVPVDISQGAADHDVVGLLHANCGCGHDLICTPDGWQHDASGWLWGDDHAPYPTGLTPQEIARSHKILAGLLAPDRDDPDN